MTDISETQNAWIAAQAGVDCAQAMFLEIAELPDREQLMAMAEGSTGVAAGIVEIMTGKGELEIRSYVALAVGAFRNTLTALITGPRGGAA